MRKSAKASAGERLALLEQHVKELYACARCPKMIGPVVTGRPVLSPVLLVGQAPGPREGEFGKPFAWTAGKTMFNWFRSVGIEEEDFRARVYMAAVCRCFPGKNPKGGDRVPEPAEIEACGLWLERELQILQPKLILPVGKLAISQFLDFESLSSVVGKAFSVEHAGVTADVIPLPHPSGASTWHRMEPGKSLLKKALLLVERHAAFRSLLG